MNAGNVAYFTIRWSVLHNLLNLYLYNVMSYIDVLVDFNFYIGDQKCEISNNGKNAHSKN